MPLLFSYGTLQQEDVQLATFGRRLSGQRDVLPGFERSWVRIVDQQFAALTGKTHHDNVTMTGHTNNQVSGTVFEVTEADLARADDYETRFSYRRLAVMLASGRRAWIYIYGHVAADDRDSP